TDLAAGSSYGYTLLFVVLLSSIFAMFLQSLSLKLGVASDRDLAQACRDAYHPRVNKLLWIVAELAIAATDLAEVVGCAIAFNLLFGIPLWAGVLITAVDVIIMVFVEAKSFRALEILVVALTALITGCFFYELVKAKPDMAKYRAAAGSAGCTRGTGAVKQQGTARAGGTHCHAVLHAEVLCTLLRALPSGAAPSRPLVAMHTPHGPLGAACITVQPPPHSSTVSERTCGG
ncbi:Divalent metal cation transporter MntH, partial [Tetrabaena socialis]